MTAAGRIAWFAMCLTASACHRSPDDLASLDTSPTALARENRLARSLAQPDTGSWHDAPLARWIMPRELREISGLALTKDGRLLAESDEIGKVWELDYRRGILVKRFALGQGGVKGDFEGIAVVDSVLYLLTSKGKLYEFHEGANHADVGYVEHDTKLKDTCEFEGVAYDRSINSLLLACKHVLDSTAANAVVIYRWRLDARKADRLSRLVVPLDSLRGTNNWKAFHPSDITIDPFTGDYVLIASKERGLIEITPAGVPVLAHALPPDHAQPEGVVITKDSILIISDEGGADLGKITLYKWPRTPPISARLSSVLGVASIIARFGLRRSLFNSRTRSKPTAPLPRPLPALTPSLGRLARDIELTISCVWSVGDPHRDL